jgi:hypothetical protein
MSDMGRVFSSTNKTRLEMCTFVHSTLNFQIVLYATSDGRDIIKRRLQSINYEVRSSKKHDLVSET